MSETAEIKAHRRELERQRKYAAWIRGEYKRFKQLRPDIAPCYRIMAEQAESAVKSSEKSLARRIELQRKLDKVVARIAELEERMKSLSKSR
jgi:hypothetical protein